MPRAKVPGTQRLLNRLMRASPYHSASVVRRAASVILVSLLAMVPAACGSSSPKATRTVTTHAGAPAALMPTRLCFRRHGYRVTPESARVLRTAQRRFDFVAVWNLLNTNRVALAVTFSRSVDGAERAAAWVRKENTKIGKGVVDAPVVRFGKVDVLWTAKPDPPDTRNIYGCVRRAVIG